LAAIGKVTERLQYDQRATVRYSNRGGRERMLRNGVAQNCEGAGKLPILTLEGIEQ
jgi:hypothetical protein